MSKFYVSLDFKKPLPSFAVESVEAVSAEAAVAIVKSMARANGWNVAAKKVVVRILSKE